MRFFLLLILIVNFACCDNKKTTSKSIEGNWYYAKFNKELEKEFQFTYQELYLSKNKIFYFDNHLGFKTPNFYKLKNDSLYMSFSSNGDYDFVSKVLYKNDKYTLYNKRDSLHFFRLKNVNNTLDKFIISNKEGFFELQQKGTEFTQGFISRVEKMIESLKK